MIGHRAARQSLPRMVQKLPKRVLNRLRATWRFWRYVALRFWDDNLFTKSAALSFQTALALVPLFTITISVLSAFPGFQDEVPFVVALVELAEQPGLRLIANIRGCSPAEVRIGMPVEVVFEEVLPGVTLPQFRAQADSTR